MITVNAWLEANYGPVETDLGRGRIQRVRLKDRAVVRENYLTTTATRLSRRDWELYSEETLGYVPAHLIVAPVQTLFFSYGEGPGPTLDYLMSEGEKDSIDHHRELVEDELADYTAQIQELLKRGV